MRTGLRERCTCVGGGNQASKGTLRGVVARRCWAKCKKQGEEGGGGGDEVPCSDERAHALQAGTLADACRLAGFLVEHFEKVAQELDVRTDRTSEKVSVSLRTM